MTGRPFTGIWPVAPTPFTEDGAVDIDGMRRVIDCMVDQGVDGICILANFSEQFLLDDDERAALTRVSLEQAAGRKPVIVTISHFATQVAEARAREAAAMGAAMVMMMPPYHGALLRADEEAVFEHFDRVGAAGRHPDHGAGRADVGGDAVGAVPGADGARDRAGAAVQDRDAAGGGEAAGADRRRAATRSRGRSTARRRSR